MELDSPEYKDFQDRIETFKMRIMFCIHKYVEDIIHTYNYNRKAGRPVMRYDWLRAFILREIILAINSNLINRYKYTNFVDLLLDQHYRTDRHIKTGINYDIHLTLAFLLKEYKKDLDRHEDDTLLNDLKEFINELNFNNIKWK